MTAILTINGGSSSITFAMFDGGKPLRRVGEGKVEQRRVQMRGMTREDWILTGQLADGDRVIAQLLVECFVANGLLTSP